MISMILCTARNGVIGSKGKLIWSIKEDMQIFKQYTVGKTVIMGRKTYESIGKPLDNRRNIILTNKYTRISGCEVVSFEDVFKLDAAEVVVIGGGTVYKQFFPYVSIIYLSILSKSYWGDTYLPENKYSWRIEHQEIKRCVERIKNEEVTLKFFILNKR